MRFESGLDPMWGVVMAKLEAMYRLVAAAIAAAAVSLPFGRLKGASHRGCRPVAALARTSPSAWSAHAQPAPPMGSGGWPTRLRACST